MKLWIITGVFILLVIMWGIILELPKTRGSAMEKSVAFVLSFLPNKKYKVINNLYFRDGRKSCQIDHIIISSSGIFVIETKNFLGIITGNGNDRMLRRRVLGMSYRTRNPIYQNNYHIQYLINHFKIFEEHYNLLIPIIVFNYSSILRIKNPNCRICKIYGLYGIIRSYRKELINNSKMNEIFVALQIQNKNNKK